MTIHELPDAELDVMSCLWAAGPSTAREVRDVLHERRPMAHATVCTLLKRLEDKGAVSREKSGVGKAYRYEAKIAPGGPGRKLLQNLLDRVFAGDGVALVAALLDSRPPTASEIEDLEQLLNDLKRRPRSRKRRT